ncbi:twin-arginine translocation signal domain-containing protein [Bradyrhizobium sp. URHC0002]
MTIERPMFPPVDPSRRGFLAQAAVAAAGGAALGLALPLPGSAGAAERVLDPILAVIQRHRTAHAEFDAAVRVEFDLEPKLPRDGRRSSVTAWEEIIFDTDDPRWIEAVQRRDQTGHKADQAAWDLVKVQPTTMAGLAALLAHVKERENLDDNDAWPQLPPDGEEVAETWSCVLHRNLAAVIEAIMVQA